MIYFGRAWTHNERQARRVELDLEEARIQATARQEALERAKVRESIACSSDLGLMNWA